MKEQLAFPKQVSYFHGCYELQLPAVGERSREGYECPRDRGEVVGKRKCCGVALISNGFIKQARKQADINIGSIRKSVVG